MSGSCVRLFAPALLAVVAISTSLPAQDFFEQKKRELAIQAQQTIADVAASVDKSRQLEKTNATEAKTILEKSLLSVNDSSALDDKQRGELRSKLLSRLKEVNATVREQNASSDIANKAAADKAIRDEAENIAKLKLQDKQKSIFDHAQGFYDNAKKTADANKQTDAAKKAGAAAVTLDIQKAASKVTEERITKEFIAKTELRKAKLSKEEAALLKILNSTISVDFSKDRDTFKDVLVYLADKAKASGGRLNILPDSASLKEAGVEYDTRVEFRAEKVTVRTVLKKVLADLGLIYVIKDGVLNVITPDRARDYLVVRTYPVQDLITPIDTRWGPVANKIQMQQQAAQLIQLIKTSIEPSTWQGVGERGYGTITYSEATMSLVISHTAEMHYMLGGGIGR